MCDMGVEIIVTEKHLKWRKIIVFHGKCLAK
jgi:hypothetical protein